MVLEMWTATCTASTGTHGGWRFPDMEDWEGRQGAKEQDNRIGMLLDLDQGSMTLWKNDVKLGVMQAEGLSGPLCWLGGLAAWCGRQRAHRGRPAAS